MESSNIRVQCIRLPEDYNVFLYISQPLENIYIDVVTYIQLVSFVFVYILHYVGTLILTKSGTVLKQLFIQQLLC